MAQEMKYRKRRYYLYKRYSNMEDAKREARYWKKRTGARYQILAKPWWIELWLTKNIY